VSGHWIIGQLLVSQLNAGADVNQLWHYHWWRRRLTADRNSVNGRWISYRSRHAMTIMVRTHCDTVTLHGHFVTRGDDVTSMLYSEGGCIRAATRIVLQLFATVCCPSVCMDSSLNLTYIHPHREFEDSNPTRGCCVPTPTQSACDALAAYPCFAASIGVWLRAKKRRSCRCVGPWNSGRTLIYFLFEV